MKRAFDLIVSVALIVVLAPVLVGIALAVFLVLGRPVFFLQERPGRRGQPFRIIKFRTLHPELDRSGRPRSEPDRLTPFGRWLRSSSLDELPELFNIAKGDMSLVGPRPLLMQYLPLYSAEQARRHDVRPGLTGWAQVHGRNTLSWEDKFALDVWYVRNRSMRLDLIILAKTILQVLAREGVTCRDGGLMPPFEGSRLP